MDTLAHHDQAEAGRRRGPGESNILVEIFGSSGLTPPPCSAWHIKPRDDYIGWNPPQRAIGRHRIVNNARFLILPWVKCPGLASRILSGIPKPLRADWRWRYGYEPVLLETFVEIPRFSGGSYRAANWVRVGQTCGRGKLEKSHRQVAPRKDIWLYPLHPHFRQLLCTAP